MNIAVYCASRPGSDPAFARDAYEVGRWIGSHGHTLVYGGSNTGLMGRVADGCLDAGGEVIGVIPGIDEILARQNPRLSRVIFTKDMADRRSEMIRYAQKEVFARHLRELKAGECRSARMLPLLMLRLHRYDAAAAIYMVRAEQNRRREMRGQ